jgi:hypothetical protein
MAVLTCDTHTYWLESLSNFVGLKHLDNYIYNTPANVIDPIA